MDSTEYYNKYANEYFDRTVNIEIQEILDRFLEVIPDGGSILDLGCGSGRDSAYFLSKGYDVTAMDGSEEMCDLASVHIGQDVLRLKFSEIDFNEVFDGIWACSSLLHVPGNEIVEILNKVIKSLKPEGVLYMSFRYGDFEGIRNERYYTDYRSKNLKDIIEELNGIELIDIWKTEDVIPGRDIIWINTLVRKLV